MMELRVSKRVETELDRKGRPKDRRFVIAAQLNISQEEADLLDMIGQSNASVLLVPYPPDGAHERAYNVSELQDGIRLDYRKFHDAVKAENQLPGALETLRTFVTRAQSFEGDAVL